MKLVRQSLDGASLDGALRDELWKFMTNFVTRSRGAFEQAVADYEFISIWRNADGGELLGFSANKILPLTVMGRGIQVIYSGWAILSPTVRGQNVLHPEGTRCLLIAKRRHPLTPVYWVFAASTFKSYLLLPRNFRRYFPRRDVAWAPFEKTVRDQVMAEQGDPNWDAAAGVVHRFGSSRYLEGVVKDLAAPPGDPEIAFYAEQNPRQHEGDTLLVVVPLSLENWWSMGMKRVARAWRRK